ncbi:caspase family protein [Actinomadura graeca]|uniref:Caspase family protein n=1 Tax=Actinomadura graeca TaxID=2750812 RepID=A0ABX8QYB9_9ACTN|nr:WD40 repeat domain-containing protein [Actinomadura graeca]QXJ23834.1 caspase family protein [Actinomadura graeca]
MTPVTPRPRALVVAVERFIAEGLDELPFAAERARDIDAALGRLGYDSRLRVVLQITSAALDALVRAELEDSPERVLVVHVITHGEAPHGNVLALGSDGGPSADVEGWIRLVENLPDRSPVLFLLDLCHAGSVSRLAWQTDLDTAKRRAWVVAACQRDELAYDGRFSLAVAAVLHRISEGRLDLADGVAHVPFPVVSRLIRQEVNALARRADHYPQQVAATLVDPSDDEACPPFFRHRPAGSPAGRGTPPAHPAPPRDPSQPPGRRVPGYGVPFVEAAAGPGGADGRYGQIISHFTGRERELQSLGHWLEATNGGELATVTGGPGSGKSSLIGVLVCAAHPVLARHTGALLGRVQHLPPVMPKDRFVAVHAAGRSLEQVTAALAEQLGVPDRGAADAFLGAVRSLRTRPVIAVDALDEALDGPEVMRRLLLPLVDGTRLRGDGATPARLLVGVRPYREFDPLLRSPRRSELTVDLDRIDRDVLRSDLSIYVYNVIEHDGACRESSTVQGAFAGAVAKALTRPGAPRQWGAFLVATLYVQHFLAAQRREPLTDPADAERLGERIPRTPAAMLDLDLATGPARHWLRRLLGLLSRAKGRGIPADVLFRLVRTGTVPEEEDEADRARVEADLRAVLVSGHHYLRQATELDGTALYSLFHHGLSQELLRETGPVDPSALFAVLGPEDARDWDAAEPYLLEHGWEHACEAGEERTLLDDPEFLLRLTPERLATVLDEAGDTVLRATIVGLPAPDAAAAGRRRAAFVLAAARAGRPVLARRAACPPAEPPLPWVPIWTAGRARDPDSTGGRTPPPGDFALPRIKRWQTATTALAYVSLDGVPVAVTGHDNGRLLLWDLLRRDAIPWTDGPGRRRRPVRAHEGSVHALACAQVGDETLVISTGSDGRARAWCPPEPEPRYVWEIDDQAFLPAVACAWIDGAPAVVVADDSGRLHCFGLADGRTVGAPVTRLGRLIGLSIVRLEGRACALTAAQGGRVSAVDLASGQVVFQRDTGTSTTVVTAGSRDRRPVAVTAGGGGRVRGWWLDDSAAPPFELRGHKGMLETLTCAELRGSPVVIAGGEVGAAHVWDLSTGRPLARSRPFARLDGIHRIAWGTVRGHAVVIVAGDGTPLQVWDLGGLVEARHGNADATRPRTATAAAGHITGWRLTDADAIVLTADDGTDIAVSIRDGAVLPSCPAGRVAIGGPATLVLDGGRFEAVVDADGTTVRLVGAGTPHRDGVLGAHAAPISALAAGPSDGGEPSLLVSGDRSGTVVVWDLTRRGQEHRFTLPSPVTGLLVLPGGNLLVNADGEVIALARQS